MAEPTKIKRTVNGQLVRVRFTQKKDSVVFLFVVKVHTYFFAENIFQSTLKVCGIVTYNKYK